MTGVWYEIARTRFTFNTMESVVSMYEYNPDKGYLDGLFTGTLELVLTFCLLFLFLFLFPAKHIIVGRLFT